MLAKKKRVFVVHCWAGRPKDGWYPWLKKELTKKHFDVNVLKMPNTETPKIKDWVNYLSEQVGKLNKNTFFVGHSIGCQTILRYLEKENKKCAGLIFVAPWMQLDENTIKEEGKEAVKIAKPWLTIPIDFAKIRKLKIKTVAVFSDNDPYVTLDNISIFEKQLHSDIILMHNKGHFSGSDKVKKIPEVLKELLEINRR